MIEELPPFQHRAPWWGGDLQTVRNKLVSGRIDLPGESVRVELPLADGSGDRLVAMLDSPLEPPSGPLVVMIHGLTGCEDSIFMRSSAAFHLKRGRRVLRLNLRGAGPSRATCGGHYHAACAPDVRDALLALDPEHATEGFFLIGYSLGGNVLLNLLAEHGGELPIRGAASISAPIDPAQAARCIMSPRNKVYHAWLLRRMKNESTGQGARLTASEREAITNAKNIYEFDHDFVAPRTGHTGADAYYEASAGMRIAPEIRVPTLMIHARNDPWIPADPYDAVAPRCPPNVRVAVTDGGGHVGFHARGHAEPWHDRCVDSVIDRL